MTYQSIPYQTEQEWLQIRQRGLGGSDAAAILGLNPWKSPVEVYFEKVGALVDTHDETPAMTWGKLLEPVIVEQVAREIGMDIIKPSVVYQSLQSPWMIASLDGEGVDQNGQRFVLECKCTTRRQEWEAEDVPLHYLVQLTHYLSVMDAAYGLFAVLINGRDLITKRINRDADIETMLIEKEQAFWQYVTTQTIPPVDGSPSTSRTLNQAFSDSQPMSVDLDLSFNALLQTRQTLKAEVAQYEDQIAAIDNRVKVALATAERGTVGAFNVTWKSVTSQWFNSTTFRRAHPDLYVQFCEPSVCRRFAVTKGD